MPDGAAGGIAAGGITAGGIAAGGTAAGRSASGGREGCFSVAPFCCAGRRGNGDVLPDDGLCFGLAFGLALTVPLDWRGICGASVLPDGEDLPAPEGNPDAAMPPVGVSVFGRRNGEILRNPLRSLLVGLAGWGFTFVELAGVLSEGSAAVSFVFLLRPSFIGWERGACSPNDAPPHGIFYMMGKYV